MTNVATPWQPVHDDVVHRLRDNLDKLGIKVVDYLVEARLHLGQDMKCRMDLVTIAGSRTRRGKMGNVVALFEVKTEPSQLFRVIFQGLQQLAMYELGLSNPNLYLAGQDKQEKLSNSLAYRKYLVIQKALWDELDDLSEDDVEKLSEVLDKWNVGIITFDAKWTFRLDKAFGNPAEEETEYLVKAKKRQRGK